MDQNFFGPKWIKISSDEMDRDFEIEPLSVARILSLFVVVSSRISFFGGSIDDEIRLIKHISTVTVSHGVS